MFPVPEKPDLSISEIAAYWSRFSPQSTLKELENTLIRAWWAGDLRGQETNSRLEALKILWENGDNDRVVFVVPGIDSPPAVVAQDDGGSTHDLRPRVLLPNTCLVTWQEDNCAEAFTALGRSWQQDMSEELFVGLLAMQISRAEFMDWIDRSGYDVPKFWGQRLPTKKPRRALTERATGAFVEHYLSKVTPTASMDETEAAARHHAREKGKTIRRLWVRTAYRRYKETAGLDVRPGRRTNPPA